MSGEPTLELCLSCAVHATGSGAIDVGDPVGHAVGHCPAVGEVGTNDWSLDDFQHHVVVVEDDLSDFVELFCPCFAVFFVTEKNPFFRHSAVEWASMNRRVGGIAFRRELL